MAVKQPHIIGAGICCLDQLVVAPPVEWGQSAHISTYEASGGGLTATALAAAARLGAACRFVSVLGDDGTGDEILGELAERGIDTRDVLRLEGVASPFSIVHVNSDTAERTIFHRRDPRLEWPPDAIVPDLSGCDLLLADNCYPPLGIAAARAARAQGIPVVADVSPKREYEEFLRHVDVWIASDKFPGLSAHSPEKALDAMHRLGPETVVLTCGDKGLLWSDPQGCGEGQAFRIEATDTTGAGDAFHGAFGFSMARGWDIGRCCEFSSAVAALNCTGLGGRASLPTLQDALTFLSKNSKVEWSDFVSGGPSG